MVHKQAQNWWTTRLTNPLTEIAKHSQVKNLTWKGADGKAIPKPNWFSDPSLTVHNVTTYRAWYMAGYPTSSSDFWANVLADESSSNKRSLPDATATQPPAQRLRTNPDQQDYPLTQQDFLGIRFKIFIQEIIY